MFWFFLTACSSDPVGVWAVLYPEAKGDPTCSNTISHTFLLGQIAETEPVQETGWSTSTDTTAGQHLAFWHVIEGQGTMVLANGEEAWLGVENDDGSWTFSWTSVETVSNTDSHEWGYEFVESVRTEETASITMALDRDVFTGSVDADVATKGTWKESDYWSQEIGEVGSSGQMPSSTYLVYPDDVGELRALPNLRDSEDCPDGLCTLSIDSFCTSGYDITGFRVQADEAATYLALEDAGQ